MTKLNLRDYTDKEIITALMQLDFPKFLAIMNTVSAILERQEKRGKLISQQMSDDTIEDLFRRIVEG